VIPLIVGTALAVAALCFVLWPLIVPVRARAAVIPTQQTPADNAIDALREIEFDRETGKISEADYQSLKARYTQKALIVMRAGERPVCERCGPRPEADAIFCSNCGSALAA
jgi:hypothetical protein